MTRPVWLRLPFRRPAPRRPRRIATPIVLQMEATECGAASLKSILGYFGRHVPLEELREACGVSRDGSNALFIKRAAESYGLTCAAARTSVEELRETPPPAILFWELNHFVVFEGISGDRVHFNDPAIGRRTMSVERFRDSYTGICFAFAPGPEFRKGGRKPEGGRAVLRRMRGAGTALAYVVLAGLVLMVCELVAASLPLVFVDRIVVEGRSSWVKPLLVALAIGLAVRLAAAVVQYRVLRRTKLSLAMLHSARFLWHVLHLPMTFYQRRYAGDVAGRVEGNSIVADQLCGQLATTMVGLAMVVIYTAVAAVFDPVLAFLGAGVGLLNLLAMELIRRRLVEEHLKIKNVRYKLYAVVVRAVQIIETIKAGAMESDALVRLTGLQARYTNANLVVGTVGALLVALPPFLLLATTSLVLWIGGGRVIEGTLTIGTLVALETLIVNINRPFSDLVRLGTTLQQLQGEVARLDDVLRQPADPAFDRTRPARSDAPRRLSGRLSMRNVTFGYNRAASRPLIEDFSLEILPGRRVALVGGSGSGKSTIGKLACGLCRPWSGEVAFDGFPIDEIPRDVFTSDVAMVDDQLFLVAGSVRDNLTLWDETVPRDDLERAAIDAAIHGDVLARPGGYQFPLVEGARNLSGGQRQRLEIARALVANPAFLVLDEATSALDALTEARIDDHLRRRGSACLIIAHRLSTIRDCDEIIVLEQGKVIQRGRHDDLMRDRDGFYYQLQSLQSADDGTQDDPPPPSEPAPTSRFSLPTPSDRFASLLATEGFPWSASRDNGPAAAQPALRQIASTTDEPPWEPCEASAQNPIALCDADTVWKVTSGRVDVFHTPLDDADRCGPRRHLFRVEEGGVLIGVSGARRPGQWGLLAVPVGEARLEAAPLDALLDRPFDYDDAATVVDNWIDRVCRALARGQAPRGVRQLNAAGIEAVTEGETFSARGGVLWMRGAGASLRLFGVTPLPDDAELGFPVSPHAWFRAEENIEVYVESTQTLIDRGELAEGLGRFQMVVHDLLEVQRRNEGALRLGRIASAGFHADTLLSGSIAGLVELAGRTATIDAPQVPDQLILDACRFVGRSLGVEIRPPVDSAERDPIRRIARASGLRTRTVRLEADWHRSAGGHMVGRIAADDRPVALLPDGARGYVCIDAGTRTRRRVTAAVAAGLSPYAAVFYRTLAPAQTRGVDLAKFAAASIRGDLKLLGLAGFLGGLLGVVVPLIVAAAIDVAVPRADRGQLALLCGFMISIGLTTAGFQAMQGVVLARIRGRLESDVVPALWDRLLNLPARFFARFEAGDLALRSMGLARMVEAVSGSMVSSLVVLAFSLVSLAALFLINGRLAIAATAVLAVCPLATALALPWLWRDHRALLETQGRLSALLLGFLGGVSRIRLMGAERRAFARWAEIYRGQLALMLRIQSRSDILIILAEIWPLVALAVVFLGYAGLPAGSATAGEFLAFNMVLSQGLAATAGLCKGLLPLLGVLEEYERFRPILQATPEVSRSRGGVDPLGGAILMSNVSFRYHADGPLVLDGIDLHVNPGEFVAVVGASGSGKTTLMRLLLGFEEPSAGTVAYDGRDLRSLDVQEVRRQIGVVLQDAQLMTGDLFTNIVGLSSTLTRADAWEAAELAGLADDIARMPMGMHTMISDGGGGLSSGQRQRLLIARSLAARPSVLLFDEATSALDNQTQAHVMRSIQARLQGVTRIAIAHRLSTVVGADRIYVMSGGKIVQCGRYRQLKDEPGEFRELALRQILS